jgi:hypothetical protein
MTKRISTYESQAAAALRDGARETLQDFFPQLCDVSLGFVREKGSMGVSAQVPDTSPYDREDVLYCLKELGVKVDYQENSATE